MKKTRILAALLAVFCLVSTGTALAAETDSDAVYCYKTEDFTEKGGLKGICITGLPEATCGTVMLGNRVICAGDILTAEQVQKLTFRPVCSDTDREAVLTYLPIFENRVEAAATMTLAVRGKKDAAPVATDSTLETYKNLPNQGKLSVSDPEGQTLAYSVLRQPRRGTVTLNADGTYTYTPKKNKVGIDSFTFTATDPAGNVSREATVTVQILKPTDATQYTDTAGLDCRFEAEWLRNTGLFVGENVAGKSCFYPEKSVSRGEFLSMLVQVLSIPTEDSVHTAIPEDTPNWLKPYLAAALRSGLTANLPLTEVGSFAADAPITGAEAAVMIQNALDLSISQQTLETITTAKDAETSAGSIPVWASVAVTAMADHGICLEAGTPLTREAMAKALYQVSYLAVESPGMVAIRKQQ